MIDIYSSEIFDMTEEGLECQKHTSGLAIVSVPIIKARLFPTHHKEVMILEVSVVITLEDNQGILVIEML